jgi:hypothetical protein
VFLTGVCFLCWYTIAYRLADYPKRKIVSTLIVKPRGKLEHKLYDKYWIDENNNMKKLEPIESSGSAEYNLFGDGTIKVEVKYKSTWSCGILFNSEINFPKSSEIYYYTPNGEIYRLWEEKHNNGIRRRINRVDNKAKKQKILEIIKNHIPPPSEVV